MEMFIILIYILNDNSACLLNIPVFQQFECICKRKILRFVLQMVIVYSATLCYCLQRPEKYIREQSGALYSQTQLATVYCRQQGCRQQIFRLQSCPRRHNAKSYTHNREGGEQRKLLHISKAILVSPLPLPAT